jgi:hypothetical protein
MSNSETHGMVMIGSAILNARVKEIFCPASTVSLVMLTAGVRPLRVAAAVAAAASVAAAAVTAAVAAAARVV